MLLGTALDRKRLSIILTNRCSIGFRSIQSGVCHQRLRQVREEVVGVFDADRQPDRRVADADAGAQLGGHARMRGAAGMAGQRLCSAQADRKLENLHPIEAGERLSQPTLDVE